MEQTQSQAPQEQDHQEQEELRRVEAETAERRCRERREIWTKIVKTGKHIYVDDKRIAELLVGRQLPTLPTIMRLEALSKEDLRQQEANIANQRIVEWEKGFRRSLQGTSRTAFAWVKDNAQHKSAFLANDATGVELTANIGDVLDIQLRVWLGIFILRREWPGGELGGFKEAHSEHLSKRRRPQQVEPIRGEDLQAFVRRWDPKKKGGLGAWMVCDFQGFQRLQ